MTTTLGRRTRRSVAGLLAGLVGAALLSAPLAVPAPSGAEPASYDGRRAAGTPGTWRVEQLGTGRWQVSWRAPAPLPMGGDRPRVVPLDGAAVGETSVLADGRTVRALVLGAQPDPAVLDVVLSGDRLDEPGDDLVGPRAAQRVEPAPISRPETQPAPVDPGEPGEFATRSSDYELAPLPWAEFSSPIEVLARVVEPVDPPAQARPLVVLLHGRHAPCYVPGKPNKWVEGFPCPAPALPVPSHLGYDAVQQLLASQGYPTVSISANGINAQDFASPDGGAAARAALVDHHLDLWAGWVAAGERTADLDRVVLWGHSRGGEGVARLSQDPPTDAPYDVAGQVLVGPTDFAATTSPFVPTVTVLPHCDGDVSDLQGQMFTDRARDLLVDDTAFRSSLLVMGANHNFFNTEWTPDLSVAPSFDDWGGDPVGPCGSEHPERLSPEEQQQVGASYTAAAVRLFGGDEAVLPVLDGSAVHLPSAGAADVRAHALGGDRTVLRPGQGGGLSAPADVDLRLCAGLVEQGGRPSLCGRDVQGWGATPHWTDTYRGLPTVPAVEVGWSAPGGHGGLALDDPVDVSRHPVLDLRTIVDPALGDVALQVRLTDAAGDVAVLDPVGGTSVPALPQPDPFVFGKHWAQTVRVDLDPARAALDLARLTTVEVVPVSDDGRVWVLDASGWGRADGSPSLLPVPDRPAPQVDLGRVVVTEGDRPGFSEARVPVTVRGTLTRTARVVVVAADERGRTSRTVVDLGPGQTTGVVRWAYRSDQMDDRPRQRSPMFAYALRGAVVGDGLGEVVVVDDDRAPRVRVRTSPGPVSEGRSWGVSVGLDRPADYPLIVFVRPVRPRGGSPVDVGDLDEDFLSRYLGEVGDPAEALHRAVDFPFVEFVRPRRLGATFAVPFRRDGVAERDESLRVRVLVRGGGERRRDVRQVDVVDR